MKRAVCSAQCAEKLQESYCKLAYPAHCPLPTAHLSPYLF